LYRFGPFVLDTRKRMLSRQGSPVPLTPKAFDLLVVMLDNPHRVLTKEELIRAVWTDAFVEEGNLTQNISILRKALAEKSGQARMIVTIARRGYQFTADVVEVETPEAAGVPVLAAVSEAAAAPEAAAVPETVAVPEDAAVPEAAPTVVELPGVASEPRRQRRRWRVAALAIPLVAVAGVAGEVYRRSAVDQPASRSERIMLAVLPFRNLTGDPAQEYLADGLTEELISRLARLHPERLGVIARTSVMAYKNTHKRLDEIGRELSVQYALESSFRRGRDRLRITVQLVQTKDHTPLWSADYDRPLEDILDVQSDVGMAVAREVELRLTPEQKADLSQRRTIDPQAYEAFLRGRALWNQRTERGFRAAIEQFASATARAPSYAEAHAGMADAYLLLGGYGYEPPATVMPKAKAAAQRAIALDGRLAEPYTTLGLISLQYDWNWVESKKNFERALELNPNYAVAHHFYGDGYLMMAGRTDEAIAALRRAHALDPRSTIITIDLGKQLVLGGRGEEGLKLLREVLEANPSFTKVRFEIAKAHRMQGRFAEALAELDKVDVAEEIHLAIGERGLVLALMGRRREAIQMLEQLQQIAQRRPVSPHLIASIHFTLGDEEAGFAALEKGYRDRAHEMVMLKAEPAYEAIRAHPRYVDLTRRMGLP
jgi:TolB-like protein/DNA-binding winged helix-turn-helix (wHTH) protein/Flp pilus assembly protein TadD